MSDLTEAPLLVVFTDFSRYFVQAQRMDDIEVAQVLSQYYELAGDAVAAAGGQVVKFIGDAMFAVFPPNAANDTVLRLLDLKNASDRFMAERGWECRLSVKVNIGSVVTGQFGPPAEKRYDVLGKTVNTAARLPSGGVALSAEVFEKLSTDMQDRFTKRAPSIAYVHAQ